jgi:hypothetical protein
LIAYTLNFRSSRAPEKRKVFTAVTDSGRTLRVETERKRGGSESEAARKTEGNREREREREV